MVADGLVEEVARLMKMGYQGQLPALSGIGYRQIIQHLTGEVSLPVAIQQIKSDTHRYVRQQYNWFRLQDERIRWFNICEKPENAIEELVDRFLEE
jgi:tRNA dimethylallyltransferase